MAAWGRRIVRLWLPLLAAAANAADTDATSTDEMIIDRIAGAVLLDRPFPDVPDSLSPVRAYGIQASLVDGIYGMMVAGYKAALTSAAAQQRFGFGEPILGILPQPNRLAPGAVLTRVPGLKIEMQIGFLVGLDDAPVAMLPVVELPRLAYASPHLVAVADVVATNAATYRFITGATTLPDPNARELVVLLERNGQPIVLGHGLDSMGDPYRAYEWMVRQIHTLGNRLEPGMILTTGALGSTTDAEPGSYVAHYGALGIIRFTIEEKPHAIQTAR